MAKTKSSGRRSNQSSRGNGKSQSNNGGQSTGLVDRAMKMGREAAKSLASIVPDALGGSALRSIEVEFESLRDLYRKELEDLYSAEQQLLKALPMMAEASSSAALRNAFETHLRETQGHVERLDKVFKASGIRPESHTCKAMQGLIAEGQEWMSQDAKPGVKDAGLIAAAQRVEHYEIAGYGCLRTYAQLLGEDQAVDLLQETLDEEGATDKKLTSLAKKINVQATNGQAKSSNGRAGRRRATTGSTRRRSTARSR
ncbi:MAG TPA: ferritin-like domain-containing protein [Pirellulales bacterium]|nr:ferritin-like domain-containing protein [Pirellulales bacterium]